MLRVIKFVKIAKGMFHSFCCVLTEVNLSSFASFTYLHEQSLPVPVPTIRESFFLPRPLCGPGNKIKKNCRPNSVIPYT